MNTLTYKGYIGSVSYSEKDNVLFGKLEGIGSVVTYEGESVAELTSAFHEAVDDYLIFCEDKGIEPQKPNSEQPSISITLSPLIHNKVAKLAEQDGISINTFVKEAVEKQVAARTL